MPRLSVVVVPVGDTVEPICRAEELTHCLDALLHQETLPAMEIIAMVHDGVEQLNELADRFPTVRWIKVGGLVKTSPSVFTRDHHDQLRAYGVAAARGELVACLEDHVIPTPRWATEMVGAHAESCDVVGGPIANGVDRALHWAVFLCDLGRYQPPIPEGDSPFASAVNVSYKREALESIKEVWHTFFNETAVHAALLAQGRRIRLCGGALVEQKRMGLRLGVALREFSVWGRSYASRRCQAISQLRRAAFAALAPVLPFVLSIRIMRRAMARHTRVGVLVRSLPYVALIVVSASWGEWKGYWTGRPV